MRPSFATEVRVGLLAEGVMSAPVASMRTLSLAIPVVDVAVRGYLKSVSEQPVLYAIIRVRADAMVD